MANAPMPSQLGFALPGNCTQLSVHGQCTSLNEKILKIDHTPKPMIFNSGWPTATVASAKQTVGYLASRRIENHGHRLGLVTKLSKDLKSVYRPFMATAPMPSQLGFALPGFALTKPKLKNRRTKIEPNYTLVVWKFSRSLRRRNFTNYGTGILKGSLLLYIYILFFILYLF